MRTLPFLLLAALLAPRAAADVLVVDDSGGAPFLTIQAAIDAAAPDDVVLVQPGRYAGFVLDGKPLSIIGATGSTVGAPLLSSGSELRNLATGLCVKLAALRLDGDPPQPGPQAGGPALRVSNCAGSVRLSDCEIAGFISSPGTLPAGAPGLLVEQSLDVVLVHSFVAGAAGAALLPVAPAGGPGLRAIDSRVSVWESGVQGGIGGGDSSDPVMMSAPGGPALLLTDSLVIVVGGSVVGGQGGPSAVNLTSGGPGVKGNAGSSVWLHYTFLIGGPGGLFGKDGSAALGPPGPKYLGAVELIELPGLSNDLQSSAPVVEAGQAFTLQVYALGGLLAVGLEGASTPLLGWSGALHVGPTALLIGVAFGPLPVVAPPLPPGVETLQVHLQVLGADHTLGSPVLQTIVADLP